MEILENELVFEPFISNDIPEKITDEFNNKSQVKILAVEVLVKNTLTASSDALAVEINAEDVFCIVVILYAIMVPLF